MELRLKLEAWLRLQYSGLEGYLKAFRITFVTEQRNKDIFTTFPTWNTHTNKN